MAALYYQGAIFGCRVMNSATNTTKIPLGLVEAAPQKATVVKNTATLKYKASYVSTEKAVTAGTGLSRIRYLLAYE